MNLIPGNILLLLLILGICMARAMPMTNDDQELTALDSVEQSLPLLPTGHRRPESEFVGRIAPKVQEASEERPEEQFDTLVQELQAAGVHTADRRALHTLTYKELVRLLALYQLAQGRNYYDAGDQKKTIA
ncbi:uncharacterized protein LOC110181912 [Drosophila serrata]|uniref:uncharacterized protein LOC110181912 n=1 Tax=Drosophila serrata TaxID=7274 RepID=UPI000A1D084A|nr:uncharacterized protein LOC110181912 [Drosophila serrata]